VELRNILKDINLSTITATNLKDIGGAVFADLTAKRDLEDLGKIVNAWQNVHVPAFGQPIPQTGTLASVLSENDVNVKILAPSNNETYRVFGFWLNNADLSEHTFTGKVSDLTEVVPVTALTTVGAGVTGFVPLISDIPLYIDNSVTVYANANQDNLTMGVIAMKITQ